MSITNADADILVGKTLVTNVRKINHEGNHATVWKGLVGNVPVIVKEHSLEQNAPELISDWHEYRSQIDSLAKKTGISTLPTIDFEVDNKSKQIRFVDQMAQEADVSNLINKRSMSVDDKIALLARLLNCFCAIPYNAEYHTKYMLDGEFSNFCPNSYGDFNYVDLFPAHLRQTSNGLLKPNREHLAGTRSLALETFLTGDIYGIIGRFWGMLRRDQPLLWKIAPTHPTIRQVLETIPHELKQYSEYLFATDTAFIQDVYRLGMQNPQSMKLYEILSEWGSRESMSPPNFSK